MFEQIEKYVKMNTHDAFYHTMMHYLPELGKIVRDTHYSPEMTPEDYTILDQIEKGLQHYQVKKKTRTGLPIPRAEFMGCMGNVTFKVKNKKKNMH
jgi:hypothetical protein